MAHRLTGILSTLSGEYSVGQQLHGVPPYKVFEVTVDGVRAVCKFDVHPAGEAGIEGRVQRLVDHETCLPVPEVLAVGSDYYLTRYDPQVPDPENKVELDGWAYPAGAGLARLHAETAREYTGVPTVEDGTLSSRRHETWTETAKAFLRHRREFLRTVGHADMADLAIDVVEENPESFQSEATPVLCHGNWLPDHVGIADGDVVAAIDFEHALFAPPAYDFWRVALALFGDDDSAQTRFEEGYRSVRPLAVGRREAYLLLNSVSYLRSLFLQDQHDPDETERKARYFREMVTETADSLGA